MNDLDITFKEFKNLVNSYPSVVHISSKLKSKVAPLSAYSALSNGVDNKGGNGYSFLLESAEKKSQHGSDNENDFDQCDGHSNYSFIGYDPDAVITIKSNDFEMTVLNKTEMLDHISAGDGDVLDILEGFLPKCPLYGFPDTDRQQLSGGLIGFLSYDIVHNLWLDKMGKSMRETDTPDAQFVLNTKTIIFDHHSGDTYISYTPLITQKTNLESLYNYFVEETNRVETTLANSPETEIKNITIYEERIDDREEYKYAVKKIIDYILEGDIYQGVISRKHEIECDVDPISLYASLKDVNPSPYMYLMEFGKMAIVGASPETLISIKGNRVVSNPIAGTCARGKNQTEDLILSRKMLSDKKELSEHTMLVDLARNDVRRVCLPGTVEVEEFMNVLKYSHVQHIESKVVGELAPEYTAFDATRAAFPAGTLSGAPKIRAMEIIDDLENSPRGIYGGGLGYYSWNGDADFAIVIRTAMIELGVRNTLKVQAGAGIVADSNPENECLETEKKMNSILESVYRLKRKEVPG